MKHKPIRTASPTLRAIFSVAEAKYFTNDDIAFAVGKSACTISHWKQGHNAPSILDVEELCGALGLRLNVEPTR